MNILFVGSVRQGGSAVVMSDLANEIAGMGHNVHVLSIESEPLYELSDNITYHHVTYKESFSYPLFGNSKMLDITFAEKVIELVRKYKIEIVHAHYALFYGTSLIPLKALLKNEVKVIVTFHGSDVMLTLEGKHNTKYLVQALSSVADELTAVSDSLKENVLSVIGNDKNVHVVPNFVSNSLFEFAKLKHDNLERKWLSTDLQKEYVKIAFVSNFREIKNPTLIPEILKILIRSLKNRNIKVQMNLVGDGPLLNDVLKALDDYNLTDFVIVHGRKSRIETFEILSECHISLTTSKYESFSLGVMESAILSVVPISSNVGGVSKLLNVNDCVYEHLLVDDIYMADAYVSKIMEILKFKPEFIYKNILKPIEHNIYKQFNAQATVAKYLKLYTK